MRVAWNDGDRTQWLALHRRVAGAMQQHPAFGAAMAELGAETICGFLSNPQGDLCAAAQFVVRRFAGLFTLALCSRGPLWDENCDAQTRRAGYRLFSQGAPLRHPRAVLFAPCSAAGDVALAGLTPLVTGEAVVVIDLDVAPATLRERMHPKWRNRLAAAERAGFVVDPVGTRTDQYQWLLEREGVQREQKGYRALPARFVPAWQAACLPDEQGMLILRADLHGRTVAAMLFLLHGRAASYHLGWSDAAGRDSGAHNLLLWQAMQRLPELGVDRLELGAINTQRGASLARFKLGTGGRLVRYAGTFR